MTKSKRHRKLKAIGMALILTLVLSGAMARLVAGPASKSHADAAPGELRIAKPQSMKQFPAELVPMP